MPPPQDWYCGSCGFGPLSLSYHVFCCLCHRHRDSYSTVSRLPSNTWSHHHAGPNSRSEDHGAHSVSAVDTESVLSRAASKGKAPSPEGSSVDLSPAKPVSSKNSKALLAVGSGTLALDPDDVTPRTVQPSSEQKAAPQGASEDRQEPNFELNKENVSRIVSIDEKSGLNGYLSVNPEDPWNQEWVVYRARPLLPGEASYSLETWEPATTSRRRHYDPTRRAEVAFTRNNGGACEHCRRRRHACFHRLQELGATIEGDKTASEQVLEGGGTRGAIDAVSSDKVAGIGSSTQYGGAVSPEPSAGAMQFAPISRQEPSRRLHGHRRARAGSSGHLGLAPSQRPQASLPLLALDDEPRIRRGRPRARVGANRLRSKPARRSARNGQGINAMSGSSGGSRQSNHAVIQETSRDFAASTPVEEPYSLGGTERGAEELSYVYDGGGLRFSQQPPHNEQQSLSSEQIFASQPDAFNIASNQRTTLPDEAFTRSEDGYANLGGTRARSSNVTDPPRSSSPSHRDPIRMRDVDESGGRVFRHSETLFWPTQQASFGQDYFAEQAIGFPLFMRDSSLSQTHYWEEVLSVPEDQPALPNLSDEDSGWQIEDGSLLGIDPPQQIFDTALLDELLVPPEHRADRHTTQVPLAMENNPQPTGPYHSSDIDLDTNFTWDDAYYGRVDPIVGSPLESYAAYLGNPIFTVGKESTSGPNSDPVPAPPSDETV